MLTIVLLKRGAVMYARDVHADPSMVLRVRPEVRPCGFSVSVADTAGRSSRGDELGALTAARRRGNSSCGDGLHVQPLSLYCCACIE
jgi:hypothetical protein